MAETFLLVDDQEVNLLLIGEILETAGYSTIQTQEPKTVQALVEKHSKQLDGILLDISMPGMDGFEVARRLQANPSTQNLPFIFVTAEYLDPESLKQGFDLGAYDYIKKPVAQTELLSRIRAMLNFQQSLNEIKRMNQILSETYDKNLMLQEIIKQYTPVSTWSKALKTVSEGKIEIPEEEKELTLLFGDIVNFTSMAEKKAPSEIIALLNDVFTIVSDVVYQHNGDIDKFIGDGFFAIFDSPRDAIDTALYIQQSMTEEQDEFKDRHGERIQLRLGINTGTVIRGNVGGVQRKDNTLISNAVNVAARMEKLCKPGHIYITEYTKEKIHTKFQVEYIGEAECKGISEPVQSYEVIQRL